MPERLECLEPGESMPGVGRSEKEQVPIARFHSLAFLDLQSNVPPHFQPSDGRVIVFIRSLWSAGLRPGLPVTMT